MQFCCAPHDQIYTNGVAVLLTIIRGGAAAEPFGKWGSNPSSEVLSPSPGQIPDHQRIFSILLPLAASGDT